MTPDFQQNQKTKGAAPSQESAPSENTQQANHNAPEANSHAARILRSRSTATLTQRERALELLKISPQTTYGLRQKGISHPAQRLKELIADGHLITSSRVNAVDSDGYVHVGVAMYSLVKPVQPQLDLEGGQ
jgi:hypothetical protein